MAVCAARLLLVFAIGVSPMASVREVIQAHDETGKSKASVAPVLGVSDTHTCEKVTFTLGDSLGKGAWGEVFRTTDQQYAVKVETQYPTPPFAHHKDYRHECFVMRELALQPNINVPRCVALCEYKSSSIFVMDLVPDKMDMNEYGQSYHSDNEAELVAEQIYNSVVSMLQAEIVNIDQRDVNILVSHQNVFFIDMGMASRIREIREQCAGENGFSRMKALTKFLGADFACDMHIGSLMTATVSTALNAIPPGHAFKSGLLNAFSQNPAKHLTHVKVIEVSVGSEDQGMRKAFTSPVLSQFKLAAGYWCKVGTSTFAVAPRGSRRTQQVDIPEGARLVGIQFEDSYSPDYTIQDKNKNISDWDPKWIGVRPGTYYFIDEQSPIMAPAVLDQLRRHKDLLEAAKRLAL